MKKSLTAFVAAAMLATVPLAMSTESASAAKWWEKAIVGGVAAGVTAGIVNNALQNRQRTVIVQQPPQQVIIQQGFSQAHYNECFRRAPNSYNPNTNTYVGYDGRVKTCYTNY